MHESTACTVLLPGSYVSESNYFENGWQHSYWKVRTIGCAARSERKKVSAWSR